jgi:hypothetical protein
MGKFSEWLRLHEEDGTGTSVGPSEDWSDPKAATQRVNDGRYTTRGVRSKFAITCMKAENRKSKHKSK